MGWSAEVYKGDLQEYIDQTRAHLLDIDAVGITLPLDIISYLVLGKLMRDDKLDKIVDNCAMSEDCTSLPYLVLDALQTWLTHKGSKKENDEASALISTSTPSTGKFPVKIVHLCANGDHNPEATTHAEPRCYEKYPHLRPSNSRQSKKNPNASASFARASAFNSFVSDQQSDTIVIDSAASHHMLRDRALFTSFTAEEVVIKTGNPDTPLLAIGHGTAKIFTNGKTVELHECLLVPMISQQLISLVRLIYTLIKITRDSDRFDIINEEGSLFSGHIVDNLLHSRYVHCPSAFINIKESDHQLWHHRLGHPSNVVMKSMGLPISDSNSLCEVCACSKMTLIPFSSHFSPTQFTLQRLHMDLVGPINPPSVSGFKYFLTIVNQYSSFKFVRFLKAKSDTFEEFKRFVNLVENLQDHSIKEVVSDQGGEFVNKKFAQFAAKKGILQVFSPAETPELNGFAERANHTILDKARCLLLTSSLPNTYWAEAVNAATFISNITFGCKAFIAVRKSHWSWKLGNTGEIGILVGFENEGSVYRILRLRDKKLIKTRHAKFDETSFPKISNESIPFSMSESLHEGEYAHDSFKANSDCSSVSTHNDEPVPSQANHPSPPASATLDLQNSPDDERSVSPLAAPAASSSLIVGDVTTSNILPSRRIRKARVFITSTGDNIPAHYHQAVNGREASGWTEAIQLELDAMKRLGVWDVVELSPGIKTVGTTWVFRKKKSDDSTVFKARLCAQGFSQVHGVDFSKTFAPTGRLNSLRALISHAAANDLEFHQLDVKTAFLNAELEEDV
ncbi:hypothetical protein PGTUg99_050100 [Puccinia graminis f. sp. tritici]|uniref:Integrase catalytic domain-containing protein n=1 Tax=Puccinia graminis f. sp. tritici TaxID=56615 RepID=A0A5B0R698_PUCGR|nr:hypothetical protein PGTUg99_050100 [Puccinia graminis f. sp. tritici]